MVAIGRWEASTFILSGQFEARGHRIAFTQAFSDITDRTIALQQVVDVEPIGERAAHVEQRNGPQVLRQGEETRISA